MDERRVRKCKRRSGKGEAKITRERDLTKSSPPRVSTTKIIRNLNKTQRLYEKHSSNQNITFNRMTIRPGIFNRGKCTSFVHRAVNLSPEKKARIDADLHRIIQLANDPLVLNHSKKKVHESTGSDRQLNKPEKAIRCEGNKNRHYLPLDENMENKKSESNSSLAWNSYESSCCRKEEKEVCVSRTKFHKLLQNTSSSSSSSHKSADVMQTEVINYSDPPVEVYEEFADYIISALHMKQKSLFPGRDYLLEARSAMKSKLSFSLPHFQTYEDKSEKIWKEKATEEKGNNGISELWSRKMNSSLPVTIDQAVGTSARSQPVHPNIANSIEYSPLSVTLSPRTTILNPIEYLKRVEKTTKQVEGNSNDRGNETNVSHNSKLSGSQEKSYLSASCNDWSSFDTLFDINRANICTSGVTSQKLIYKHSNRCYIESPQAVEFKEAKFLAQQSRQQLMTSTNPLDSLTVNNIVPVRHSMSQKLISDMEVNRKNVGFEYLMNVSALPGGSNDYDCCDLLDDLDASDCHLITDENVICTSSTEGNPAVNKWCPPPSPDTAEHKFYRRKMF